MVGSARTIDRECQMTVTLTVADDDRETFNIFNIQHQRQQFAAILPNVMFYRSSV